MAKDQSKDLVIWPEYFDINLTRKQGRRVKKEFAVQSPSTELIFKISRNLGLYPELESDKVFPSRWFASKGRVKVKGKYSKTETIRMIAEKLR